MNMAFHGPAGRRIIMQQQFGDVGTRHERTFIDVKAMFAQPRFVGKVSSGYALLHAALEKFDYLRGLHGCDHVPGRIMLKRELQRVQCQVDGFVAGVGGAVPIAKSGIREPALATARERADGSGHANGGARGFTASQARRD